MPNFHFFPPCWMTKQEEGSVGKPAFTQVHPSWPQEQGELSWGPVLCLSATSWVRVPPDSWVAVLRGLLPAGGFSHITLSFSSPSSLGCFSEKGPCKFMANFVPHPGHQHPQFLLLPFVCRDWRTSLTSNLPTGQPWPWQRVRSSLKFLWGMNFMGKSTLTAWTLPATV